MNYQCEIRFRLLPHEKQTLIRLAKFNGLTQSAFVRNLIAQEARKEERRKAGRRLDRGIE